MSLVVSSGVAPEEADKPPEVSAFGHYTTVQGVMGMISEELLWATNIRFLNDQHEFQHSLGVLRKILAKPQLAPQAHKQLFAEYQKMVGSRLDEIERFRSESVFTLSFSAKPDLLSQWRGYCPENNGYCVIYDVDMLLESVKAVFPEAYLFKCVYEDEAKKGPLREILNRNWSDFLQAESAKSRREITERIATEIRLLAAHFKDTSFSEEQERRIVVVYEYFGANQLKFRAGRSSIIPYLELPAPRAAVKKIIVGPNRNQSLATRALEAFLETRYEQPIFVGGPEVVKSEIPYRSL